MSALRAAAHRAIHGNGRTGQIQSPRVPNACIYSLGVVASAEAIAALQDLQRTARHAGYRKQIGAALADAARRAGLTPGQLVERVVPGAALDSHSERRVDLAPGVTARIRVTEAWKAVIKQAFREVYLPTPAERETRTYSNRFAAYILHYQQAYALMKARAWTTDYLGPHGGGHEGHARREFPDAGLTAVFDHYAVEPDPGAWHTDLCSTDRVLFCRTGDRAREPMPLEDVPDLVFSEAMRDVDLFISVALIGLDQDWADRGGHPHAGYWQAYSFGELSETARVRRDALAWIVPGLKIASCLELGDRFLRVSGNLNTYKIHVGSGNVQAGPDDRHLCIVPAGRSSSNVTLPFDDDPVLSVILSKAILLAADDKITDETILRQLTGRG